MALAPAPEILHEAVARIGNQAEFKASVGVILGSGLGDFVKQLHAPREIAFVDIPGFPESTVEGHSGKLIQGMLGTCPILVNAGRVHFYEGYTLEQVIYPIRLLHALGVQTLIITNAAGSTRAELAPGELLVLHKLLNLTGRSILAPEPENPTPFNPDLQDLAIRVASAGSGTLHTGCYAGLTGPSYETPAEVRWLRHLGADAVGMSTIHETVAAKALGMDVLGISCLTNYAAGILDQPLNHAEVMETGERVQSEFAHLLSGIIRQL
jgi:purine-nucleoside phosphorylase